METLIVIVFVLAVLGLTAFLILKAKNKKKDKCVDGSCDKPVDPCADGSCDKPVDPCADGSCDKPVVTLSINVSLKPNNAGTKVPEGVFCTRTKEIIAVEEITGNDCAECVKREWFENGVVNPKFNGLTKIPPPFYTGREYKYRVTIGDVSKEVSTGKIK